MQDTMTIKQISELTGKTERTIRQWVRTPSEKISGIESEIISSVSEKISGSGKTKKPAEFSLEETLAIVKAGGNETLASLLKDNAEKNKPKSIITDEVKILIKDIIKETISAIIPLLQNKPIEKQNIPAIENKTEQKNYKYLTLKIIGENLNPKLKPSQVGRMLFELGYSVQINNSFTPSFRCTKENKASEQSSIYGGTFYAWHKDFIGILQDLLNKETKLF